MPNLPRDPLESLQREVERLFHDLVYRRHPAAHFADPVWSPPADLVVSKQDARVLLELAGVPRESIQVRIRGRVLEVSGRREAPQEPGDAHYHRAEIFFGDFRRLVELPWDADPSNIEAQLKDGMLRVRVLRAPAPQATEIEIEGSGEAPRRRSQETTR
jgi:HSP20 family protein